MASKKKSARTLARNRRRVWYFAQQRGLCCLQITNDCTARGGLMSLGVDKNARNYATFEHLTPQSVLRKKKACGASVARVQLLACKACNCAKGARDADQTMLAVAALFFERWRIEALGLALEAKRAQQETPAHAHRRAA